jgi:hypothetical protein
MSDEPPPPAAATTSLGCLECGRLGGADVRGWRALHQFDCEGGREEGEIPTVVFYCAACRRREFD